MQHLANSVLHSTAFSIAYDIKITAKSASMYLYWAHMLLNLNHDGSAYV